MRGSREISIAPSLRRASTDALIWVRPLHAHAPTIETTWRRTGMLRGVATREVCRPETGPETVSFSAQARLPQQRS